MSRRTAEQELIEKERIDLAFKLIDSFKETLISLSEYQKGVSFNKDMQRFLGIDNQTIKFIKNRRIYHVEEDTESDNFHYLYVDCSQSLPQELNLDEMPHWMSAYLKYPWTERLVITGIKGENSDITKLSYVEMLADGSDDSYINTGSTIKKINKFHKELKQA
jgi:hypothetical protein